MKVPEIPVHMEGWNISLGK